MLFYPIFEVSRLHCQHPHTVWVHSYRSGLSESG